MSHKIGTAPQIVYCVHMTKTLLSNPQTLQDLQDFMFDELWSEIQDAPGEIFDVIEWKEEWEKEEKFNVENYINGNTDY